MGLLIVWFGERARACLRGSQEQSRMPRRPVCVAASGAGSERQPTGAILGAMTAGKPRCIEAQVLWRLKNLPPSAGLGCRAHYHLRSPIRPFSSDSVLPVNTQLRYLTPREFSFREPSCGPSPPIHSCQIASAYLFGDASFQRTKLAEFNMQEPTHPLHTHSNSGSWLLLETLNDSFPADRRVLFSGSQ